MITHSIDGSIKISFIYKNRLIDVLIGSPIIFTYHDYGSSYNDIVNDFLKLFFKIPILNTNPSVV